MNKKIFGRTQKFLEEIFKIFVKFWNEKILRPNKKIFGRRFFRSWNIYDYSEKYENRRNEDSESLLVTKIIVCQFHKHERACFPEGHRTWPENVEDKDETVFEELKLYALAGKELFLAPSFRLAGRKWTLFLA